MTKAQLKRRSKKRRSANNTENGDSEVKAVASTSASKPQQNKVQAQPNGTPKLNSSVSSKKGGQKNETPNKSKLQEKNNTKPIQSPVNGSADSVAAKKKRKKKKKSKGNTSVSNDKNVTVDLPSDDDEEPPAKTSRKSTGNLVPNPVAIRKANPCHVTSKGNGPVSVSNDIEKKRKRASVAINESVVTPKQPMSARPGPTSAKKQSTHGLEKSASQPVTPATSAKQTVQVAKSKTPQQQQKVNKNLNITRTLATTKSSKPRVKSALPHTVTSNEPPIDIKKLFHTKRTEDSIGHAKEVLQWLINPVTGDQFMNEFWEKKPLLIKRKHNDAEDYYKWILTSQLFDDVLRRNPIKYGINLDITSYVDGKRETLSESMQGTFSGNIKTDLNCHLIYYRN